MIIEDEEYLIASSDSTNIHLYNPEDLIILDIIVDQVDLRPVFLKSHESTLFVCTRNNGISIIKFESIKNYTIVKLPKIFFNYFYLSMDFTQNLQMISAAFNKDKSSIILMNRQKERIKFSHDHSQNVSTVVVSKGFCNRIITGSFDKTICIKNMHSTKNVKILKKYFKNSISSLMFFENEKKIIISSFEKIIKIISLINYQVKIILKMNTIIYAMKLFRGSLFVNEKSYSLKEFKDFSH